MQWEEWEKNVYTKDLERIEKIDEWRRIEDETLKLFPEAKIQYLDKDLNKWFTKKEK